MAPRDYNVAEPLTQHLFVWSIVMANTDCCFTSQNLMSCFCWCSSVLQSRQTTAHHGRELWEPHRRRQRVGTRLLGPVWTHTVSAGMCNMVIWCVTSGMLDDSICWPMKWEMLHNYMWCLSIWFAWFSIPIKLFLASLLSSVCVKVYWLFYFYTYFYLLIAYLLFN